MGVADPHVLAPNDLRATADAVPALHPLSAAVDRLLAALKDYPGAEVLAVSLESPSGGGDVWLSNPGKEVLSILIDRGDS